MLFGALAVDLGCFPFDHEPYRPQSHSRSSRTAIRSLMARSSPPGPFELSVALPSARNNRGCTSMHFGENQLLPNSISFSLLTTGHPRLFQQALVRSSMRFHPHFNLPMARSSGFGSIACNFRPLRTRFRFGSGTPSLNLATHNISPAHFSIGTLSLVLHRWISSSNCL